jgi:hypothetical protein
MTTDYTEVMSGHSNETLVKILTVKRDQYQPEALDAAQQELEKRGLKLSDFAETQYAGAYAINGINNGTSRNVQAQPDMESLYDEARKKQATKDMLYGALWCVGGIVATASDIGAIFWGAILFGGIQFVKGLINSQS